MPVMNSGTPSGPSSRSPSPELAAATGWLASASSSATANSPKRTVPELTTRRPARFCGVAQGIVDGLQSKVGLRQAEPVPILIANRIVWPLPEPHEADL